MKYRQCIYLCVVFFGMVCPISGQISQQFHSSAKGLALGSTGVSFSGIESIYTNQAGLVDINDLSIIVSSEQRFVISELSIVSLGIAKKIDEQSAMAFYINQHGFDQYKEQRLSLIYARALSAKLKISTAFDYQYFTIKEFGSKHHFNVQIGGQYDLNNKIRFGAHVQNPFSLSLNDDYQIDTSVAFGIRYQLSEKVQILSDLRKTTSYAIEVALGVDYKIHEKLDVRLGFASGPSTISFGFAYHFSEKVRVDGSFEQDQILGITPGFSAVFEK